MDGQLLNVLDSVCICGILFINSRSPAPERYRGLNLLSVHRGDKSPWTFENEATVRR